MSQVQYGRMERLAREMSGEVDTDMERCCLILQLQFSGIHDGRVPEGVSCNEVVSDPGISFDQQDEDDREEAGTMLPNLKLGEVI